MAFTIAALRTALRHLTTPLILDDYTSQIDDLWSARELRGRIEHISRVAEDTVTLHIRTGWGVPRTFRAGQHIGLGVQIDGRWRWRSYSLTGTPNQNKAIYTITVREVRDGTVSHHLIAAATVGTPVRISAPSGEFHLPTPVPQRLIFLSAGSGITPIMAMIRSLRLGEPGAADTTVAHIHLERSPERLAFAEELQRRSADPRYHLDLRYTGDTGRPDIGDLADAAMVASEREGVEEAPHVFACGPSAMLDAAAAAFRERGVEETFHREQFSLDRQHTTEGGTISFGTEHVTSVSVEADGATTILEAGESAGLDLAYGCRMGVCSTCTIPLLDGSARDLRTGEILEPGQRIRACSSVAAGDCRIAYAAGTTVPTTAGSHYEPSAEHRPWAAGSGAGAGAESAAETETAAATESVAATATPTTTPTKDEK